MHRGLCAFAALVSVVAQAAVEWPGVDQTLTAARAQGTIRVDGRMDEPSWGAAPVFDQFVQRFPEAGAPPTERTELRALYDASFLYVSVICRDSSPDQISRQMGRRDSAPASDNVQVLIDAMHDHRTAYQLSVNAGGVLTDGLWFGDRNFTRDWDGVWEGAAVALPDGWSAELAIPLSQLQFPVADVQTWLGSTLYAIYTRQQPGAFQPSGAAAPRTVLPVNLFGGPAIDPFILKWSYYWTV